MAKKTGFWDAEGCYHHPIRPAKKTTFAVGRRYRCERELGKRDRVFDFVILGKPNFSSPSTHKLCRIEVIDHGSHYGSTHLDQGRCCTVCSHGLVQDYSHKHLKKYGVLVDEPVTTPVINP